MSVIVHRPVGAVISISPQLTAAGVDCASICPDRVSPSEVAVKVQTPSEPVAPVTSPEAEITRPSAPELTIVTFVSP